MENVFLETNFVSWEQDGREEDRKGRDTQKKWKYFSLLCLAILAG